MLTVLSDIGTARSVVRERVLSGLERNSTAGMGVVNYAHRQYLFTVTEEYDELGEAVETML